MRLIAFYFVSMISLVSCLLLPIQADTTPNKNPDALGPVPPPQLVDPINQVVTKAMKDIESGVTTSLLPSLRFRADEALPFLQPYISSSNEDVRWGVAFVASGSQTEAAVQILSALVLDVNEAINSLFNLYNCQQITEWGGDKLKTNLIERLKKSPQYSEAILLLSCFDNDPKIVEFLKKQRAGNEKRQTMITSLEETPLVPLPMSIDIALAELKDNAGLRRALDYFVNSRTDNLWFIFRIIKFVDNKQVLLKIVETLKDKRVAYETIIVGQAEANKATKKPELIALDQEYKTRIRVCDMALKALLYKTGETRSLDLNSSHRFSDEELEKAYLQFKAMFGNVNNPIPK